MNIFVAKLSSSTSKDLLFELFGGFGHVDSATVIMDRETGRSKGFGFVEMPNDDEALAAIHQLNESSFNGSQIVVKKSEPRENNGASRNKFRKRTLQRS